MNQYIEKIKKVELITDTKYFNEFVDEFVRIRDWAKSERMHDKEKLAQYEIEICSLYQRNLILESNKKESRFTAKYTFTDGTKFPDVEKFTDEQFKYYEERLVETDNIFLKVRYSDFLFEYGDKKISLNKFQVSQYLLLGLVEISNHYRYIVDDYQYISSIARLVEVSLLMGNKEKLKKAINLISLQLAEWNRESEYRWTFELSKLLRIVLRPKLYEIVSDEITSFVIEVLENARERYLEEKEYFYHKMFCKELIEYRKFGLLSSDRKAELLLEIGKSYELESEYQPGREKKSLIVQANFLELAMNHYANIGEKEKINEMKILIKQVYEQCEESDEMETISIPFEISSDYIERIVSSYMTSDIPSTLDKLACSNQLIPKADEIKNQVNLNEESFPFQSLVSKSIISDGRKIDHTLTEEDSKNINFISNYMLCLNLNLEIVIKSIFERLSSNYHLNVDDIMEKFERWGCLDARNRPLVESGIRNFFEGDYIASIHILVPQFESTLKRFFSNKGFHTTSIKKETAQHEETFNEFLNREDIKGLLGENVHKLIQIVMVEQSGLNLRNEVAHGIIKFSDITKTKCILVIFLFLILTRYKE